MYFMLYSNIVITKGKKRSLLIDLQYETMTLIPNTFASFICFCNKKKKCDIYNKYDESQKETVDEYLDWLEQKGYLFWIDSSEMRSFFTPLPIYWDSPFRITNIIVDIDATSQNLSKVIAEINACNIPFLQVRFYGSDSFELLHTFIALTKNSSLKGIEIAIRYKTDITQAVIKHLIQQNIRISQLFFYAAPFEQEIMETFFEYPVIIKYSIADIKNHSYCGMVRADEFKANMPLYMESQAHNTCLNRKIAIDATGEIRNCPSMATSYGNIATTSLAEAIEAPGFQKLWHIHKDQISTCKDCEFRHVCTDCRAYLSDPGDLYSKPLKCGYNPYTNEWADWSSNPLSKAAITHYGLAGG
jgi:SPASM domain peptide maturase of grasp-with-spasm system